MMNSNKIILRVSLHSCMVVHFRFFLAFQSSSDPELLSKRPINVRKHAVFSGLRDGVAYKY